jgi:hypothetical protein
MGEDGLMKKRSLGVRPSTSPRAYQPAGPDRDGERFECEANYAVFRTVGVELGQLEVVLKVHDQAFMSLRQYSYIPRISVSVTMWSVSPTSRPPSSASVRWNGFCSKPLCDGSITSPSSAETKPAGPNRLAWVRAM